MPTAAYRYHRAKHGEGAPAQTPQTTQQEHTVSPDEGLYDALEAVNFTGDLKLAHLSVNVERVIRSAGGSYARAFQIMKMDRPLRLAWPILVPWRPDTKPGPRGARMWPSGDRISAEELEKLKRCGAIEIRKL